MKYLLLLVGFGWSGILLAQEKISVGFQGGINAPGLVVRSANPVVDGYKTKLSAYFGLMAEEGLSKKWSLVEEIDYANMTITKSGAQVIPRSAYDNLNLENVSSYPHLYATFDSKIQTKYIADVLIKMRMGGASNKNLRSIIAQNCEIMHALRKNELSVSVVQFWLNKIFTRAVQYFSRP